MRIVALLACLAALGVVGCGASDEQAASPPSVADLTVTVDADGDGSRQPQTTTVKCDTADASKACRAADGMDAKTFEPVGDMVACTQQYGGPETATVKGTLHGDAIDAKFSRVNGCEISRWEAAAPLLEAAG
jgi:ABC-type phosphate transport system substrate-binding protein